METTTERLNVPTFRHFESLAAGQLELGFKDLLINIRIKRSEDFYKNIARFLHKQRIEKMANKVFGQLSSITSKTFESSRSFLSLLETLNNYNEDKDYFHSQSSFGDALHQISSRQRDFNYYYGRISMFAELLQKCKDHKLPTVIQLAKELTTLDNLSNATIKEINNKTELEFITDDIVLFDPESDIEVPLGKFKITIDFNEDLEYKINPLTNEYKAKDGDYYHPHIANGRLCEGEASPIIQAAIAELRITDMLDVIMATVKTYNPGSPYLQLKMWNATNSCNDCGEPININTDNYYECIQCNSYICEYCKGEYGDDCYSCEGFLCGSCVDEHMIICDSCDRSFCSDCITECDNCGDHVCSDCQTTCKECGEILCEGCVKICSDCDKGVCSGCLTECSDCSEKFCSDCLSVCERCNDSFCSNCMDSRICKNCEEDDKEEEEDE